MDATMTDTDVDKARDFLTLFCVSRQLNPHYGLSESMVVLAMILYAERGKGAANEHSRAS